MTEPTAMIPTKQAGLARGDVLNAFASSMRLHVVQGHSSPEATRVYAKIVNKLTENPTLCPEKLIAG